MLDLQHQAQSKTREPKSYKTSAVPATTARTAKLISQPLRTCSITTTYTTVIYHSSSKPISCTVLHTVSDPSEPVIVEPASAARDAKSIDVA